MARIYGYGEDSLTYNVLSTQLQQLLIKLRDDSLLDKCRIVYRPSFGRAGGSQFGEFDAIVQTTRSTFLIESKWDHIRPAANNVILKDVQTLRHRIFKWMRRKWMELRPPSWAKFKLDAEAEFSREFNGRKLANNGTLLARNCFELLLLLQDGPAAMTNVLLYFISTEAAPTSILDERLQPLADPFELCIFSNPNLNASGYILMVDA